jgi:rhodanese-related sulfurtransferase
MIKRWKPLCLCCAMAAALLATLANAQTTTPATTRVLINPGDTGEQSRMTAFGAWKMVLDQALRKDRILNPSVMFSNDATTDLGATRSRIHDIFIAPAHVIGSAIRYGYTPVLGLERPVQAVMVAPQGSTISNLAQAVGKRLGLPLQDSVVTYLLRGEVNAANTTLKRHFGALYETRYQEALLTCLQLRRCDLVVVERAVYERWVAAGESLKVVLESRPVPGLSVAIRDGSRPGPAALAASLTEALGATSLARTEIGKTIALTASSFDYVSTLGYFTPRTLPGATVVDAKTVAQLMQRGTAYVDTRTDVEFKAGRVPDSKLVPYVEKSAKEADYDAKQDQFDLSQLPQNKQTELIFGCNGAECWKSFKASHAAIQAGYTKVYWFRGGLPEWRSAGLVIVNGN